MTRTPRVLIDGRIHQRLPLATLERILPDRDAEISYPEQSGWAVSRIGTTRFCAWVEVSA